MAARTSAVFTGLVITAPWFAGADCRGPATTAHSGYAQTIALVAESAILPVACANATAAGLGRPALSESRISARMTALGLRVACAALLRVTATAPDRIRRLSLPICLLR